MEHVELISRDGLNLEAVRHRGRGQTLRGSVLVAHGITADLDEGGMLVRLADRLAATGFDVVRFSFRATAIAVAHSGE